MCCEFVMVYQVDIANDIVLRRDGTDQSLWKAVLRNNAFIHSMYLDVNRQARSHRTLQAIYINSFIIRPVA